MVMSVQQNHYNKTQGNRIKNAKLNKTAIVIGATGLVGSALVVLLAEAKHIDRVVVVTRRAVDYEAEKVENHVIDFEDLNDNRHLFAGDVFFSCLGTTVKLAGSIAAQRKVDLEYQYTAARLAREQNVSHYVLVSSSGANSKSLSPYLKMKGELEAQVQGLAFEHTSIIQPSLLLGDRDDSRIAESLGSRLLPIVCRLPGLTRYRPIHGEQVAEKMVFLSQTPKSGFHRISLDDVFPT